MKRKKAEHLRKRSEIELQTEIKKALGMSIKKMIRDPEDE